MIDKGIFIETIEELKQQLDHDVRCGEAFTAILPNDFVSGYDNHWVVNQLIKMLKVITNDDSQHSWIEYYIWELDFGRKWKKGMVSVNGIDYKLKTTNDLWNIITNDSE